MHEESSQRIGESTVNCRDTLSWISEVCRAGMKFLVIFVPLDTLERAFFRTVQSVCYD